MMIKKTEVMDEKYRWLSCVHESGGDVWAYSGEIKKQVESEAKLNKNRKEGKVGSCENGSKQRGRNRHLTKNCLLIQNMSITSLRIRPARMVLLWFEQQGKV